MKQIKNRKNKIKLYFIILISNIISTLIFNGSVFRYILCFILIYLFMKIFKINNIKENTVYDFFVIPSLFLIKMILEYIIFFIIFNFVNYITFVIIIEFVSILFALSFKKVYVKIYTKIKNAWLRLQNSPSPTFDKKDSKCYNNIVILFLWFSETPNKKDSKSNLY